MSMVASGFEKLKLSESRLDFHDIYTKLKDEMTCEVDGFILQDEYLYF